MMQNPHHTIIKDDDSSSCHSDDSDLQFAHMDFSGVNFDTSDDSIPEKNQITEEKSTNHDTKQQIPQDYIIDQSFPTIPSQRENSSLKDLEKDIFKAELKHSWGTNIQTSQSTNEDEYLTNDDHILSFSKVYGEKVNLSTDDFVAIKAECAISLHDCQTKNVEDSTQESVSDVISRIKTMTELLSNGKYLQILNGPTSKILFGEENNAMCTHGLHSTVAERIRNLVINYCKTPSNCVEVELLGISALNLFIQINYTGPSLLDNGVERPGEKLIEEDTEVYKRTLLKSVNPHELFSTHLKVANNDYSKSPNLDKEEPTNKNDDTQHQSISSEFPIDTSYQNTVLGELAVDGEWPCVVCKGPYFLLLARSILLTLADPNRPFWTHSVIREKENRDDILIRAAIASDSSIPTAITSYLPPSKGFVTASKPLVFSSLWSARAAVAHNRLLLGDEPSAKLWHEVEVMFERCQYSFCQSDNLSDFLVQLLPTTRDRNIFATKIMLELGLAEHHFDKNKRGKTRFISALGLCGLDVKVTGAEGKRTKYQKKATSQMLVKAKPSDKNDHDKNTNETNYINIQKQMVELEEDTILLDKVKYEDEEDNQHYQLSILEQTVLMALCLDVKNDHPMDGLTAEEMGAYLERVLQQHDDWMVYATGLLERAWLEYERNHTKMRAILQIQALADQHTNRLTLTQSTFKAAVEDSAPPQERLKHIHYIVYPPRWLILADLGTRLAKLGIVTSAAQLFEEIEQWDDVVECYRRAGKENTAEKIVRERLEKAETPRMWAALGDITKDPIYYERALELSHGRYAGAYVALGNHYFEKGELLKAAEYLKKAVDTKPLSPHIWFRLGTISMRLKDWKTALKSFTEVVEQEPEEADAWANVAAVHMHNRNPKAAYPALVESLKINRNNWRVWFSKLYTCLDLMKYDEAIQASLTLLDLRSKKNESEGIPPLEEKVVRGIVGGAIQNYHAAIKSNDVATIESAKRTVSRVRELLTEISSCMKSEPWIFETCAYFNENVGRSDLVVDELMKEYRALLDVRGWEIDKVTFPRACKVITQIAEIHLVEGKEESLCKFKFLLNGFIRKIKAAHFDRNKLPKQCNELESLLSLVDSKLQNNDNR